MGSFILVFNLVLTSICDTEYMPGTVLGIGVTAVNGSAEPCHFLQSSWFLSQFILAYVVNFHWWPFAA